MSEKKSIQTCLVVGGGISGLTASTILEQHGRHPGGFYGGWITSNIVGPFKGAPGTWDW